MRFYFSQTKYPSEWRDFSDFEKNRAIRKIFQEHKIETQAKLEAYLQTNNPPRLVHEKMRTELLDYIAQKEKERIREEKRIQNWIEGDAYVARVITEADPTQVRSEIEKQKIEVLYQDVVHFRRTHIYFLLRGPKLSPFSLPGKPGLQVQIIGSWPQEANPIPQHARDAMKGKVKLGGSEKRDGEAQVSNPGESSTSVPLDSVPKLGEPESSIQPSQPSGSNQDSVETSKNEEVSKPLEEATN